MNEDLKIISIQKVQYETTTKVELEVIDVKARQDRAQYLTVGLQDLFASDHRGTSRSK